MVKSSILVFCLMALVLADQTADLVSAEDLKAFNINLSETLYAGYLAANDDQSAQFYYMFVLTDPKLPVTLWLNGGPGCSSMQGLFNENGPVNFIHRTATLKENQYSWTKLSNMLYLESPIGVGFSYGDITPVQTDQSTAKYNLQAVVSFFRKFNQFQGSQFYITGESYAGIYIPTLATAILDYNALGSKPFGINLKGVMIGNGCTHVSECTPTAQRYPQHRFNFLGGHNLISAETFKNAMDNVASCYGKPDTEGKCQKIDETVSSEFTGSGVLNPYNVYSDCPFEEFSPLRTQKQMFVGPSLRDKLGPCDDEKGLYTYFRNPAFLKVVHVDTTKSSTWWVCPSKDTKFRYQVDDQASYYLYPRLIESGLRIWKFSGDIDAVVPITGTLYWIDQLQVEYNLRTLVPFRMWYKAGDKDSQRQVGGNYWKLDGLTFVSVRGAGHMVPTDQKLAAFDLFQAFLLGQDLPAS